MKPLLKCPGGKSWLVSWMKPQWEAWAKRREGATFVELFAGGAGLAFGLEPKFALLNDLNSRLIGVYIAAAECQLERYPDALERYYEYRDRFNQLVRSGHGGSVEAESLFLLLNKCGYNGLIRFNRKGEFNVPKGAYSKPHRYYDLPLGEYFWRMKFWQFCSLDFSNVTLRRGDFVYADPPYYGTFTGYTGKGFTEADQVRLVKMLADYPGPVVATNSYRSAMTSLYLAHGFQIIRVKAPRTISCNGAGRQPVYDMLAFRNLPVGVVMEAVYESEADG